MCFTVIINASFQFIRIYPFWIIHTGSFARMKRRQPPATSATIFHRLASCLENVFIYFGLGGGGGQLHHVFIKLGSVLSGTHNEIMRPMLFRATVLIGWCVCLQSQSLGEINFDSLEKKRLFFHKVIGIVCECKRKGERRPRISIAEYPNSGSPQNCGWSITGPSPWELVANFSAGWLLSAVLFAKSCF